jgi:hypothetical protein
LSHNGGHFTHKEQPASTAAMDDEERKRKDGKRKGLLSRVFLPSRPKASGKGKSSSSHRRDEAVPGLSSTADRVSKHHSSPKTPDPAQLADPQASGSDRKKKKKDNSKIRAPKGKCQEMDKDHPHWGELRQRIRDNVDRGECAFDNEDWEKARAVGFPLPSTDDMRAKVDRARKNKLEAAPSPVGGSRRDKTVPAIEKTTPQPDKTSKKWKEMEQLVDDNALSLHRERLKKQKGYTLSCRPRAR